MKPMTAERREVLEMFANPPTPKRVGQALREALASDALRAEQVRKLRAALKSILEHDECCFTRQPCGEFNRDRFGPILKETA